MFCLPLFKSKKFSEIESEQDAYCLPGDCAGDKLWLHALHAESEEPDYSDDRDIKNVSVLSSDAFECAVCLTRVDPSKEIKCGGSDSQDRHSFCRDCLRGHAKAAAEEMPLAAEAVGLKCMDFGCANPIYWNGVRRLISRDVRKRIDDRIVEENLALAGLKVERCIDCTYAVELDEILEQNKVFHCFNCGSRRCRLCDRKWDEEHVRFSCDGVAQKDSVSRKQRLLEAKMNEIVIRKCEKCGLQFTKDGGCNLVTCRCGTIQCYVCRKSTVYYGHSCLPTIQTGCSKSDRQKLKKIRTEYNQLKNSHLKRGFCAIQ